eukprot:2731858-Rhodomonas_salina.2
MIKSECTLRWTRTEETVCRTPTRRQWAPLRPRLKILLFKLAETVTTVSNFQKDTLLSGSVGRPADTLKKQAPLAGAQEKRKEQLAPSAFVCSLGLSIMRDPVTCTDGHSYERASIQSWLADNSTSPKTG